MPLLPGDVDRNRPSRFHQRGDRRRRFCPASRVQFGGREVAERAEIVQAIDAARLTSGVEMLQLRLDLGERVLVQQLAQLGLTEQLAQLVRSIARA